MGTAKACWTAAVVLICCGLAGSALAAGPERLKAESRFGGKVTTIEAELFLPQLAAGQKIPAMILMHGSSPPRERREYAYVREFLNLGVAAVVINSFKPRGIKDTVRDQDQISSSEMLADAMGTLRAVANRPEIDASRIGLIGYSKGGAVASKLALRRYTRRAGYDGRDFALLIAMYPWCGNLPLDFAPSGAPLFLMMGAADTYTGLESCKEFAPRFEKAGGKVHMEIFKDAQHGWDVPGDRNWVIREGENFSKCFFDEIAPGTWVERSSGIKVEEGGKRTGKSKEAQQRCVTRGVSGGYHPVAHAQSLALIKKHIRETLQAP